MGDRRDPGAAVKIVEAKIVDWGDVDPSEFRIVPNVPPTEDMEETHDRTADRWRAAGNGGLPATGGSGKAEEMKAPDHVFARRASA